MTSSKISFLDKKSKFLKLYILNRNFCLLAIETFFQKAINNLKKSHAKDLILKNSMGFNEIKK